MRLIIMVGVCAVVLLCDSAYAQSRDDAEAGVRATLEEYFRASRQGNGEDSAAYFRDDGVIYTAGGVNLGMTAIRRAAGARRSNVSAFIRHIQFLTTDTAVAIGLWRDVTAPAPYDAGTANYTLVLTSGAWKIVTAHFGFIRPPDTAPPSGNTAPVHAADIITADEQIQGWMPLFDGETARGWLALDGRRSLPSGWRVADGSLISIPGPNTMAIRTERSYTSFEMAFEWKVGVKGNSGVKYRVFGVELNPTGTAGDAAGFEYQVADDRGEAGALRDPKQRSGALYGVTPVPQSAAKTAGEWNQSRIVVTADRVEHWLNGMKTSDYPVDISFPSPIVLQHHSTECHFRRLKIRTLK